MNLVRVDKPRGPAFWWTSNRTQIAQEVLPWASSTSTWRVQWPQSLAPDARGLRASFPDRRMCFSRRSGDRECKGHEGLTAGGSRMHAGLRFRQLRIAARRSTADDATATERPGQTAFGGASKKKSVRTGWWGQECELACGQRRGGGRRFELESRHAASLAATRARARDVGGAGLNHPSALTLTSRAGSSYSRGVTKRPLGRPFSTTKTGSALCGLRTVWPRTWGGGHTHGAPGRGVGLIVAKVVGGRRRVWVRSGARLPRYLDITHVGVRALFLIWRSNPEDGMP